MYPPDTSEPRHQKLVHHILDTVVGAVAVVVLAADQIRWVAVVSLGDAARFEETCGLGHGYGCARHAGQDD